MTVVAFAFFALLAVQAPLLWDEASGNLSYRFERGDKMAVDAAFAGAAHVVEIELVNNRLVAAPIEPRAAIGDYDVTADRLELLLTGQGVHSLRRQLAAELARKHRIAQQSLHLRRPGWRDLQRSAVGGSTGEDASARIDRASRCRLRAGRRDDRSPRSAGEQPCRNGLHSR